MSMKETFLSLVRLGIGHTDEFGFKFQDSSSEATLLSAGFKSVDWVALKALAERQGLTALVLDGLDLFMVQDSRFRVEMPAALRLEWIGEVLQNYEQRYKAYEKAIGFLAGFYNWHGFQMMVLKGYGLSLNWPNPKHRTCGDIDIWLFGQQEAADKELVSSFMDQDSRFKIDTSHHHHTVFEWKGFSVENHYDFVNVHYGHRNAELEKVFKGLAKDDSYYTEIYGERVYLPSPILHALFLLRHCMQDFASAELNLRQVLDWAFFVEKHTKEIDWEWLLGTVKKYKMTDFFNCLNAICVDDLRFDAKLFPYVQFNLPVKEKVLNEILEPSFSRREPCDLFPRLVFKYKRWKGNAWKQELCYHDSRASSFFTGVWNHLLKPKSI